jgi:hypothetical protein
MVLINHLFQVYLIQEEKVKADSDKYLIAANKKNNFNKAK